MIPITRSNARYDLGAVVIEAIRTGNMDWSAVVRTVVRDLGGFVLEQVSCKRRHVSISNAE